MIFVQLIYDNFETNHSLFPFLYDLPEGLQSIECLLKGLFDSIVPRDPFCFFKGCTM